MPENQRWVACDQPEALVLVKVLPLCQINTDDLVAFGMLSANVQALTNQEDGTSGELPACRIAVMTCLEARALIEGVDYVGH